MDYNKGVAHIDASILDLQGDGRMPVGMRMKRFMTAAVATLMIATMFISCASGTGEIPVVDGEMEVISVEPDVPVQEEAVIEAEDESKGGWLNAMGTIDGMDVKGFRLRGEGPDGASFDWVDVKGTKVALSDIRRGEWDLYAEAIGHNGEVVATGHLKTFLSESTPLGTLFLSEEVGSGDVSCDFGWTTTQVLYPSIEVYMKTEDGDFMARDPREVKIDENGHAVWTAKDVPAGSYIVRALLKDEGEVVSGVAAALRVIDGKTSVGNCRFVIGKLSTVVGIGLQNSPIYTGPGDIALEAGILSFVSDVADLKYSWFLDGSLMNDFRNMKDVDLNKLELKKGFYRIDCIASNPAGFSSINTDTVFVYSDGAGTVVSVTEEQADSRKGDVPEGYMEVPTTDDEDYTTRTAFVLEGVDAAPAPVEDAEAVVAVEPIEAVGNVEAVETPVAEAAEVEEAPVEMEPAAEVGETEPAVETDETVVPAPAEAMVPPVAEEAENVPPAAPAEEQAQDDVILIDLFTFMPSGAAVETIRP